MSNYVKTDLVRSIEQDPESKRKLAHAVAYSLPTVEINGKVYVLEKVSSSPFP
jgi:hypothetical protein